MSTMIIEKLPLWFHGANHEFNIELDFDAFNNLTITQAEQTEDFFPNKEALIEQAREQFMASYHSKEQSLNKYMQKFLNEWTEEKETFNQNLEYINFDLTEKFQKLAHSFITVNEFEEFLDNIQFENNNQYVIVSSNWCNTLYIGSNNDSKNELVLGYIVKLVKDRKLYLEGFGWEDNFFWSTLYKKYN